jgi:ubiquinol-cytochrome c reductase cytochrome c1 subunit
MKKNLITFFLLCFPVMAMASSGGHKLEHADINLENKQSLRNGAKLFVNYCMSCHSASYMRYNRMARDIGLSDKQVLDNMIFVGNFEKDERGEAKKPGDLMTVAMQKKDAKAFFGTEVPDLTVVSRARGADWLYTYLTSFYADETRPFGVNNELFHNVGMPHVLWQLQGMKKKVTVKEKDSHGHEAEHVKFETITEGTMSDVEYKRAMNDLVNFMVYMGEPIKMERQRIGIFVMFFLIFMFVLAYLLKKEYWNDIH